MSNKYLAQKILKACKAQKIVYVASDTFAGLSTSITAADENTVLAKLKTIAKEEGFSFSLLEKKDINYRDGGGEYCIYCVYDAYNPIFIRFVCSADVDDAECRMLLSFSS